MTQTWDFHRPGVGRVFLARSGGGGLRELGLVSGQASATGPPPAGGLPVRKSSSSARRPLAGGASAEPPWMAAVLTRMATGCRCVGDPGHSHGPITSALGYGHNVAKQVGPSGRFEGPPGMLKGIPQARKTAISRAVRASGRRFDGAAFRLCAVGTNCRGRS